MLRKVRNLFARRDSEFDGNKPRDAYMDVLKEIQAPPVRRRPLVSVLRQAAGAFARTRPGRRERE